MKISSKHILMTSLLLVSWHLVAKDKSYVSKSELSNPLAWFAIDGYDTAILYSIFFTSHEDPNDKAVKIAVLRQELINDGIPLMTLAYAKMAYNKQVNEVLSFFIDADKPTRELIVRFVDWSYNRDKIYRAVGGLTGVLCLALIVNQLLT